MIIPHSDNIDLYQFVPVLPYLKSGANSFPLINNRQGLPAQTLKAQAKIAVEFRADTVT